MLISHWRTHCPYIVSVHIKSLLNFYSQMLCYIVATNDYFHLHVNAKRFHTNCDRSANVHERQIIREFRFVSMELLILQIARQNQKCCSIYSFSPNNNLRNSQFFCSLLSFGHHWAQFSVVAVATATATSVLVVHRRQYMHTYEHVVENGFRKGANSIV